MSIGPAKEDEKIETCVPDDCRRVEVVTGVRKDSSGFSEPITPAIGLVAGLAAVKTLVAVTGLLIPWDEVWRRHCIACGAVLPKVGEQSLPSCNLRVDVEGAGDFAIAWVFPVSVPDPDRLCKLPRGQRRCVGDIPH